MTFNKLKAVSYVELILVLALVGIIAALTVPGIKKHSQRTEMGRQAQKAYLNINDAVDNAIAVNGPMRNWKIDKDTMINYITPFFRVTSRSGDTFYLKDSTAFTFKKCEEIRRQCPISVDVNGDKPPNAQNKDIIGFNIDMRTEKINLGNSALKLQRNNWTYTDDMWE